MVTGLHFSSSWQCFSQAMLAHQTLRHWPALSLTSVYLENGARQGSSRIDDGMLPMGVLTSPRVKDVDSTAQF